MLVPLYPHIPKHEQACNETWGATATQDFTIQKNIIAINCQISESESIGIYHNFVGIEWPPASHYIISNALSISNLTKSFSCDRLPSRAALARAPPSCPKDHAHMPRTIS